MRGSLDIDVKGAVGHYIDDGCKVEVMAFDCGLEVVELSLGGVVTVVEVHGGDGH